MTRLLLALTLKNLRGPVGKLCPGVAKVKTVAQFWEALDACTADPPPAPGWPRLDSIPAVPRNYDPAAFLRASDYQAPSAGDDQAAFRLDQGLVGYSYADPIFGVDSTHLHAWINRPVRRSGMDYGAIRSEEMPVGEGGPINRSIYGFSPLIAQDQAGAWWVLEPSADADGTPRAHTIYYKLEAADNPFWARHPELVRSPLPRGLRMLGGIKHYPVERWPWQHGPAPVTFSVWQGPVGNEVMATPTTHRLADVLPDFTPGRFLRWSIVFPRLYEDHADSPDHVSHVAYHQPGREASLRRCGPEITMIGFVRHPGFPIADLACSSDLDHPDLPRGATMHGYFLEGWDDELRGRMHTVFDRNLSTSNGEFGDGTALSRRDTSKWARPGLIRYSPNNRA